MKPSQKAVKVAEKDTVEVKESKLQYYVRDQNGTKKLFEAFVRSKYGFTKGIIGQEVLEALENHMALYGFGIFKHKSLDFLGDQGPAHKKLKATHESLLRHLEEEYQTTDVIKFKDIQDIMNKIFKREDTRTHKNWTDALRASAYLIQPDGVKDYDYYFFKEMPKPRKGRPAFVVDVQTKLVFPANKIFELLPGPGGVFTVQRLRKLTTLKEDDLQTALKQLKNFNIIEDVGIGQFKVKEPIEV